MTDDDTATASQANSRNVSVLKYQAEETAASMLNAKNQALAAAPRCQNCAASGIAFRCAAAPSSVLSLDPAG